MNARSTKLHKLEGQPLSILLSKLHLSAVVEFEIIAEVKNEGILYVITQKTVFDMNWHSEMSCTLVCTK